MGSAAGSLKSWLHMAHYCVAPRMYLCCQRTVQGPTVSWVCLWQAEGRVSWEGGVHCCLGIAQWLKLCSDTWNILLPGGKPFASILEGSSPESSIFLRYLRVSFKQLFTQENGKIVVRKNIVNWSFPEERVLQIPFLDGYKRCNKKDLRKQLFVRDLWMSSGIYQHHFLTSFFTEKEKKKKTTFD